MVEVIRRAVRRARGVGLRTEQPGRDNIFERLLSAGERAVRLGHRPACCPNCDRTPTFSSTNIRTRLARKLVKEAMGLFRRANRFTRAKPEPRASRIRQDSDRFWRTPGDWNASRGAHPRSPTLCTTTALDSEVLARGGSTWP